MARISVKAAKAKGRLFQQSVRDEFIELAKISGQLTTDTTHIESRQMGGAGEDIRFMDESMRRLFPYYVECKQMKTGFNPHKKFDDLFKQVSGKNLQPLIFHRRDRHETLVTLDAGHFFKLMRELFQLRLTNESLRAAKRADE